MVFLQGKASWSWLELENGLGCSDENTEKVSQRLVRGVKRSPQNGAGRGSKKKLLCQNGNTASSLVNLLMLVFTELCLTTEF